MKNIKMVFVKIQFILITLLILIISVLIALKLLIPRLEFNLNGQSNIIINYLEDYVENGATAKSCNYFSCKDISSKVQTTGKVNNKLIGTYEITYEIKFINQKYYQKRIVNVVDTILPTIELHGETTINTCPNQEYIEEGFEAIDNYDGNITPKVTKELINDTIQYRVVDSSGNESIATRNFVYKDNESPQISLVGNSKIYIEAGSSYIDAGYNVSDNCDAFIESKVKTISNVDTSKAGSYTIKYSVTDNNGNIAAIKREVIVYNFNTTDVKEYIQSLEYYIESQKYNVSIGYLNLKNNYAYYYNADKVYYGASLIKTLDALYVYEKLEVTDNLKQLVNKAISVSDNAAHFKLVSTIGFNNLKEYGASLGAKNTLTRGSNDYYGNTTVHDQIIYMKKLYNFINNNSRGVELQSFFVNDYCNYITFEGSPQVMHKYGYYGNYFHESSIVLEPNNPYILIILTQEGNNNYKDKIRDLSFKIYNLNKLI